MVEAAGRTGGGLGADTARRLLTRTIRHRARPGGRPERGEARTDQPAREPVAHAPVHPNPAAPDRPEPHRAAGPQASPPLPDPAGSNPRTTGEVAAAAGGDETVDALRRSHAAELRLMKAVLDAERRENAYLRACVGIDARDDAAGPEARAVRERWARIVDRLLQAAV